MIQLHLEVCELLLGGDFFFLDGQFLLGEMGDSRFRLREFFTNLVIDDCFHSGCVNAPFVVNDLLGECAEARSFFVVGGGGGDCCGGHFVTDDDCTVIVDTDGEEWYEGLEDEGGIVEDLLLLGGKTFQYRDVGVVFH